MTRDIGAQEPHSAPDGTPPDPLSVEVDPSPPSASWSGTASGEGSQERLANGTLFAGRYRIEQWLGRGGMGAVYLVHDVQGDRRVALKLMHRSLGRDVSQAKRFHREARILARLHSAHVVAVYDHGRTEDDRLYLAMEFLEGETLHERLRRLGHLPVTEALAVMVSVLDGLAAVHRAGIIHRDVKPANIFLARRPSGGEVAKLLDFGVAKVDTPETTELTRAGTVCGTPRFMSPEQVLDRAIDFRSDLFSAGVVLYLALTGAMPYESDTTAQLVYALMQSTPIPLTRRRADLATQTDLNRVVLHALERAPTARYQSAQEMAAELRVLLAAQQTTPSSLALWPRWLTPLAVRSAVVLLLGCSTIPFLELGSATQAKYAGFAINSNLVSPIFPLHVDGQDVLPLRDEIVAIDGHTWRRGRELRAYLAALPLGATVSYRLRRDNGREHTVTARIARVTWQDLRTAYGLQYIGGLLIVLIGATVAWSRSYLAGARALLLTTGMIGLSLLTARDQDFSGLLAFMTIISTSLLGCAFAHLGLAHPLVWAPLRRHSWLLAVLYALGGLVTALGVAAERDHSYLYLWLRCVGLLDMFGISLLLIRQNHLRKHGTTVAVRQAARQMLWATTPLILLGGASALVSVTGVYDSRTYLLAVSGLTLFALGMGYQIRRRDLFDLDLMFARLLRTGIRYMLLVLVFGVSVGAAVIVLRLLGTGRTTETLLAPLIGISVVSLAYEPLIRRMRSVGRHGESDNATIIAQFSSVLRSAEDMLDVVELLFDTLQRRYRPQQLRLLERDGGGYLVRSHDNSTATRPALVADVLLEPGDSDHDPSQHAERLLSPNALEHRLSRPGRFRAHAGLILPMTEDHSAATQRTTTYRRILVLGPRGDGHTYSGEDAGLVAALVHLAATRLDAIGEVAQPLDSLSGESYDT